MGKQFDVYVPVRDVEVLCHSKILDDLGEFTRFVIWAIGSGYSEEKIKEIIMLDEVIVDDALEELEKWKFAKKEKSWELTNAGQEYFALIKCMDRLEQRNFFGCIELFTGQIELDVEKETLFEKNKLPPEAICLEVKVAQVLFQNDNYENSLELIKKKLQESELLEKKYMSSLYTTLKFPGKEIKYRKYTLNSYSAIDDMSMLRTHNSFMVAIPIVKLTYKKKYQALDPYRSVLETLKQLKLYEQSLPYIQKLLTTTAIEIVNAYEKELEEPLIQLYIDEYAGELIQLRNNETKKIIARYEIEQHKWPLLRGGEYEMGINDNSEFRYERVCCDTEFVLPITIDFKRLVPMGREDINA